MNKFIIVDGLPYLYANGKAYTVRWDAAGFTVGEPVELKEPPTLTYNELSIKAKCAGRLNSIRAAATPEQQDEKKIATPEKPTAKKKPTGRRKAVAK